MRFNIKSYVLYSLFKELSIAYRKHAHGGFQAANHFISLFLSSAIPP